MFIKTKPKINNKFYFIILLVFTSIISAQNNNLLNEQFAPTEESSNLPLIFIDTKGQQIFDEERIVAHMGIIDNGEGNRNYVTDEFNNYDGLISIELRGSSSSAYPKPQFRFETQDSLGENFNVSLCGLPTENDWILNGPYSDKSLVRNVLAYGLSNQMGRYASRTVYCELILNGYYMGLYILMEKIKRDNDRIDISKLTEIDNSGDELTGGYIVKLDKPDGENIGYWLSTEGTPFQYHYPKPNDITQEQMNYIENYFNEIETLLTSSSYNHPINGYRSYIDVDSFVDHFILNELCKNVDAYRISAFLHKDKDSINPKLIAGPIWDFNLTFGDAWIPEERGFTEGWQIDYSKIHPSDPFKVPFWWQKLFEDDYFMGKVKQRWFELREDLLSHISLFSQIDNIVNYISEGSERNFLVWPEILSGTHDDEILKLKAWILKRLIWMDTNLDQFTDVSEENNRNLIQNYNLFQNYPNPFNPETVISYQLPVQSHVKLVVYDMLGRKIASLVNKNQTPGKYEVNWDPSISGLSQSTGVYFYTLRISTENNADQFIQTRKMLFIK